MAWNGTHGSESPATSGRPQGSVTGTKALALWMARACLVVVSRGKARWTTPGKQSMAIADCVEATWKGRRDVANGIVTFGSWRRVDGYCIDM